MFSIRSVIVYCLSLLGSSVNNYWFIYYFVSRFDVFTEVYDLNTTLFFFEIMFDICYGFVIQHSYVFVSSDVQIYLNVIPLSHLIDIEENIL